MCRSCVCVCVMELCVCVCVCVCVCAGVCVCVGVVCLCRSCVFYAGVVRVCRSCVCTLLFRLEVGEAKIPPVMVTWSLGYLKVFVSYGKMACHLQALRIISETISHFGCYMYYIFITMK